MAYASQTDLTNVGLPANALATLTTQQISAALQSASDRADAAFRARYGINSVPLVTVDSTIVQAVAKMAAYELMVVRGMKPGGPDWELFKTRYDDAIAYLDRIQRQQAHPLVTLAGGASAPQQPNLASSSVVNLSNGASGTNRGW